MGVRWIAAALGLLLAACAASVPALPHADRPLIIAHRGASGELPEHTMAAYERAIERGADYIEPDLVLTKDGILVARHENEISATTDIAARAEFAHRRTTKTIDGEEVAGWFTEDFTLAELKTLRARERLPELRGTANDGRFAIATFAEVLALARETGVGVYLETKYPAHFEQIGLSFDEPLIAALRGADMLSAQAPVFVQSFETEILKRLAAATPLRLVQLIGDPHSPHPVDASGVTAAEMLTPAGLTAISAYAAGIGPNKSLVIRNGEDTDLLAAARASGLEVHPWTFRKEARFVAEPYPDMAAEICAHAALGVDAVFTDHVREAAAALGGC